MTEIRLALPLALPLESVPMMAQDHPPEPIIDMHLHQRWVQVATDGQILATPETISARPIEDASALNRITRWIFLLLVLVAALNWWDQNQLRQPCDKWERLATGHLLKWGFRRNPGDLPDAKLSEMCLLAALVGYPGGLRAPAIATWSFSGKQGRSEKLSEARDLC